LEFYTNTGIDILCRLIIYSIQTTQKTKKMEKNAKISFCLDSQTVEALREEFKARKTVIDKWRNDPEAKNTSKRIGELISALDKGEEIIFNSEVFEDEEFLEDFTDELIAIIDYFFVDWKQCEGVVRLATLFCL